MRSARGSADLIAGQTASSSVIAPDNSYLLPVGMVFMIHPSMDRPITRPRPLECIAASPESGFEAQSCEPFRIAWVQ